MAVRRIGDRLGPSWGCSVTRCWGSSFHMPALRNELRRSVAIESGSTDVLHRVLAIQGPIPAIRAWQYVIMFTSSQQNRSCRYVPSGASGKEVRRFASQILAGAGETSQAMASLVGRGTALSTIPQRSYPYKPCRYVPPLCYFGDDARARKGCIVSGRRGFS